MAAALPSTFVLMFRRGIWRVTFDGVFFGDYRTERAALEGVGEAQRKLACASRVMRTPERQA